MPNLDKQIAQNALLNKDFYPMGFWQNLKY
jgi:hypothetical protein